MLYQNCRELSCHIFNELFITGDLKLLVKEKSKVYTSDELIAHWHLIIDEFNELTKNTEAAKEFKQRLEIIYLNNLIYFLHFIQATQHITLTEEVKTIVETIKKEHRIRDVSKHIAKSNNRLSQLMSQIEKEKSDNSKVQQIGFEEIFAELISQGTSFNRHTTSVSEFAFLLNIMKKKNSNKPNKK